MAKKYFIETYGCQMNVHDSERMAGLLEQAGYEATVDDLEADVVVINTCSVRERAQEKLFSRLGTLATPDPGSSSRPLIAVAGCVAQQEGARILARAPYVDVVVGTQGVKRLPALLEQARPSAPQIDLSPSEDVSFPFGITRRADPVKGFVTIVEGCNDFCSFCVVPYTRGHERMRPAGEILSEVADLAASGRREVQLLGQIVNHYQAPDRPDCDFPTLVELVHEVPGIERIRFASPHPRFVTSKLIETVRVLPKVCKHFHLPVQSGSNRILERMRRRIGREEYLELVSAIREAVPGICLSTDMIVGFPGETERDFEDTLSLTSAVRFHSMFSFVYSARPNTLAAKRMPDDVPDEEKSRRLLALQDLQRSIQWELHRARVGTIVEVLADSRSRRRATELSGRTSGNTVVNFPGLAEWLGRTVDVVIERAGPNSLWGQPMAPPRLDSAPGES